MSLKNIFFKIEKILKASFFAGLFWNSQLTARGECAYEPLFAGTLLTFLPLNAAPGHISIQPFFYAIRNCGFYNRDWDYKRAAKADQYELLCSFETGITPFLDIALDVDGVYSHSQGRDEFSYGDTVVYLGWQILSHQQGAYTPDIRLLLGESFPTGKYQRLDPQMNGVDSSGKGVYSTTAIFVIRDIFCALPRHPIALTLNFYCIVSTKTDVKGPNAYGGGPGTRGIVHPGSQFVTNVGIEYSLDRFWVLGLDVHYLHQWRTTFKDKTSESVPRPPATGLPASDVISLAPCIEYNFSANFSVEAGAWFSVAGRSSIAFYSAVANLFYYF